MNNQPKICFNTANLVAEYSGWTMSVKEWSKHDKRVVENTTDATFTAMCGRIRDAGFGAVELWQAHAHPSKTDSGRAKTLRSILDDHGLQAVAWAGPLNEETAPICATLGIDRCCYGNFGQLDADAILKLKRETGIDYLLENHFEPTIADIKGPVPAGCGVALDTGWLGTQRTDAVEAVRELGKLIRHVHLKDVGTPGEHDTVPLGTGVVNLEGLIAELKSRGYGGWWSWEDEPEDRNPYDIASDMRRWIEERVG